MAWEHAIVHLCMDREEEPRYGVHGAVPVEWESNSFLKVVTRWHCASRTKGQHPLIVFLLTVWEWCTDSTREKSIDHQIGARTQIDGEGSFEVAGSCGKQIVVKHVKAHVSQKARKADE